MVLVRIGESGLGLDRVLAAGLEDESSVGFVDDPLAKVVAVLGDERWRVGPEVSTGPPSRAAWRSSTSSWTAVISSALASIKSSCCAPPLLVSPLVTLSKTIVGTGGRIRQ